VVVAVGIFIAVTTFSSLLVMGSYLLHFEEYNALYKVGKTIPTPIIHVRYGYFLALGAIGATGLFMDRSVVSGRWRKLIIVMGVWLVVCVHILAVRTGIFALYGGFLSLGFAYAILRRGWRPLAISIAVIAGLFAGSIVLLPSVGNKVQYMMHDLTMLRTEGISPEYSDNLRLISIMHGMAIFVQHPLIGVGIGDVEDEMEVYYNERSPMIPQERRFPPISQYVFWLCGFGLVGTSILVGLLIYPLLRSGWQSYLLIGVYALTAFSFLAETTIQLQLGKTVFVLLVSVVSAGILSRSMQPGET
jgi:O-antigen ligase